MSTLAGLREEWRLWSAYRIYANGVSSPHQIHITPKLRVTWQPARSGHRSISTEAAVHDSPMAVIELDGGTAVHYLPVAVGEVSTEAAVHDVPPAVRVMCQY